MMSPDDSSLPRDPGPLPAPLREAFAWARDTERAGASTSAHCDALVEAVTDEQSVEEARLAAIDQLLSTHHGASALAHLVAARTATFQVQDLPADDAGTVMRPFVAPATPSRTARVRPRSAFSTLKPILLAASLMLVASTSWYVFTLPRAGDEVRSSGSEVELQPLPSASASSSSITLRWKSFRTDARYTIEVLDASDAPVFSTETSGTSAVIPAATLRPGVYRWYVRSRATDGTEIRSRVEKFTVR
ncbi:MAG TPA: hypothetical protein VE861_12910 [Gemmatimonadaceae bacterium]|nr:hypothetical protein [Gemmatimonadaceae bacterium]